MNLIYHRYKQGLNTTRTRQDLGSHQDKIITRLKLDDKVALHTE